MNRFVKVLLAMLVCVIGIACMSISASAEDLVVNGTKYLEEDVEYDTVTVSEGQNNTLIINEGVTVNIDTLISGNSSKIYVYGTLNVGTFNSYSKYIYVYGTLNVETFTHDRSDGYIYIYGTLSAETITNTGLESYIYIYDNGALSAETITLDAMCASIFLYDDSTLKAETIKLSNQACEIITCDSSTAIIDTIIIDGVYCDVFIYDTSSMTVGTFIFEGDNNKCRVARGTMTIDTLIFNSDDSGIWSGGNTTINTLIVNGCDDTIFVSNGSTTIDILIINGEGCDIEKNASGTMIIDVLIVDDNVVFPGFSANYGYPDADEIVLLHIIGYERDWGAVMSYYSYMISQEAEDFSCTKDGNIAYYSCEECDIVVYIDDDGNYIIGTIDDVTLTATEHSENTNTTYTSGGDGTHYIICSVCEETIEDTLEYCEDYKAYKDNVDGSTHKAYCEVCEYVFDSSEAHTYDDGVLSTDGTYYTYTCEYCKYCYTEDVEDEEEEEETTDEDTDEDTIDDTDSEEATEDTTTDSEEDTDDSNTDETETSEDTSTTTDTSDSTTTSSTYTSAYIQYIGGILMSGNTSTSAVEDVSTGAGMTAEGSAGGSALAVVSLLGVAVMGVRRKK